MCDLLCLSSGRVHIDSRYMLKEGVHSERRSEGGGKSLEFGGPDFYIGDIQACQILLRRATNTVTQVKIERHIRFLVAIDDIRRYCSFPETDTQPADPPFYPNPYPCRITRPSSAGEPPQGGGPRQGLNIGACRGWRWCA